jgi:hypothetical protein
LDNPSSETEDSSLSSAQLAERWEAELERVKREKKWEAELQRIKQQNAQPEAGGGEGVGTEDLFIGKLVPQKKTAPVAEHAGCSCIIS